MIAYARGVRRRSVVPSDGVPTSSLNHRFRADDITGLSSGSSVTSWTGRVGGAVLSQVTAANQPVWISSAINSFPAVRWPSTTNTSYLSGSMTTISQPITASFVINNTSTSNMVLFSGANIALQINAAQWYVYAGSNLVATGTLSTNAPLVATVVFNGSTSALYINGTSVASGAAGGSALVGPFYLGENNNNTRQWQGDIAEFFIWSKVLSTAERASLHTYVQRRYAISVSDYTP